MGCTLVSGRASLFPKSIYKTLTASPVKSLMSARYQWSSSVNWPKTTPPFLKTAKSKLTCGTGSLMKVSMAEVISETVSSLESNWTKREAVEETDNIIASCSCPGDKRR